MALHAPSRSLWLSGLLGGVLATTLATFGAPPSAHLARPESSWPPHPKQIVQIVDDLDLAVAPDDFFELLTVPEGQTLVVERLWVISPETNPLTLCGFEPYEERGGTRTKKGRCSGIVGTGSGTGAVFRSGSKVVVQNVTGQTTTVITVDMLGYYRSTR